MDDRLEEAKNYPLDENCTHSFIANGIYKWLIAEVERLRLHQGWDTENMKLQREVTRFQLEGNIRCVKCGAVYPEPHKGQC